MRRVTKVDGLEPNQWPIDHFANVGYYEPFVWNIVEIDPVIGATSLSEAERLKVKHALMAILTDGLVPAFLDLQQIRASVGKKMPVVNREEPYGNMGRKLWKSYKPLMSDTASAMGYKIGFLYDNDKKFKEGLEEFRKQNPALRLGFEKFLEDGRTDWQKDLANFRNKWLEHPVGNRKQFDKFYTPEYAEEIFQHVWSAIADILPLLLELKLVHGSRLIEQAPDDPGPKWPQRFRYDIPEFRNLNLSSS
jgi:hypothetical protein